MSRREVYCPDCDAPLPEGAADWERLEASCAACGRALTISGYLEPEGDWARHFQPLSLKRPSGLKLKRAVAPGVEIFRLGGDIFGGKLRFERGLLVFKGFLGRERETPLDEIDGFAAVQNTSPLGHPPTEGPPPMGIVWHVVSVSGGVLRRLWEFRSRDHARYLASELNRTLLELRSGSSPYRG